MSSEPDAFSVLKQLRIGTNALQAIVPQLDVKITPTGDRISCVTGSFPAIQIRIHVHEEDKPPEFRSLPLIEVHPLPQIPAALAIALRTKLGNIDSVTKKIIQQIEDFDTH